MTDWRVLVPIKQGNDGKSRLGVMMGKDARAGLAERMAIHVLEVLQSCFDVQQITILSPHQPKGWKGRWLRDQGRGLNPELTDWRKAQGKEAYLVIHADLPLLSADDVKAIIVAADNGAAIATDRVGEGTNAVAISDGREFIFCFGTGSRALHCRQYPDMLVLEREGLVSDLDTPADAHFISARGFSV